MVNRFMFLLFLLCLIGWTATGAPAAETLTIGVVLPLTGELAKFGKIEKTSFNIALDEINAAGGINGQKLALIIEDTTGKPEVARSAVEKLISKDKVLALCGGYSSSETFAAVAVAQQLKIPYLVNTGAADAITAQGWNYVFRLNQTVSDYPQALLAFLNKMGDVKTAAVIFENTLFGQSSSKEITEYLGKQGVKVVLKEGYEAGSVDFKPMLVTVKSAKPDLVYMISYLMDASLIMRQSKELNFNPKLFAGGGGGFTLPEFRVNAGDAAEYVYSATLWTPDSPYPGAKAFSEKYSAQAKSPATFHAAQAYAAVYVLADALKRAKSPTPADIRDALAQTDLMTAYGR
ncbi:MAG: ABC transporter substrate-binding protein, partial [Deltaproteobacteria bacterium]|nr:ABC transporter substrate-binding protein [Deltaproteobacteria bacterium]